MDGPFVKTRYKHSNCSSLDTRALLCNAIHIPVRRINGREIFQGVFWVRLHSLRPLTPIRWANFPVFVLKTDMS